MLLQLIVVSWNVISTTPLVARMMEKMNWSLQMSAWKWLMLKRKNQMCITQLECFTSPIPRYSSYTLYYTVVVYVAQFPRQAG